MWYSLIVKRESMRRRRTGQTAPRKGRTNMHGHSAEDIFKLGFGLMRLPKLKDGSIDVEQVKEKLLKLDYIHEELREFGLE